jgi:hypothetical protein
VRVNILSYNIKKWLEDTSFQITKIFDSAKQSNKLFVVFVFFILFISIYNMSSNESDING